MHSIFTRFILAGLFIWGLALNSNAQIKGASHIGSIGGMGLKQRVFTGPVVINDNSCFTISNGVSTLKHHSRINAFTLNCELMFIQTPEIILIPYPNPSNSYVTIKSATSIPLKKINSKVLMELLDVSGHLIMEFNAGLFDLDNGYRINLSHLVNGTYFIKVSINSLDIIQTVKIIKAD